jgi:hypothetical protein
MDPSFFITDYGRFKYMCDDPSLIKMTSDTMVAPGIYLYCIIPDGTLCLFDDHHSAGACGQPVICAGNITIKNNKIKRIDNSSGHYYPPHNMLEKAISILKEQNLIVSAGELDKKSGADIKYYNFKTTTRIERIKRALRSLKKKRTIVPDSTGGKRRKYTRRLRKKHI